MEGVDIVVVNYKTPDLLRSFLKSLIDYGPACPWTINIANVAPDRGDVLLAEEFPGWFNWLGWSSNIGFGRTVNATLRKTSGTFDTIAIFNADTRLTEDVADSCRDLLYSNEEYGVVGPRQVSSGGLITHAGFVPHERGFKQRDVGQFTDIRDDALTVSGSAYFIKRTVWDELTACNIYPLDGAFLPTPHYYEETWCSYHARAHGYKVVYNGAATMIHEWHKSSKVGGHADKQIPVSRDLFHEACREHGIIY